MKKINLGNNEYIENKMFSSVLKAGGARAFYNHPIELRESLEKIINELETNLSDLRKYKNKITR